MNSKVKRYSVVLHVANDSPFRQTGDSCTRPKRTDVVLATDYAALEAEHGNLRLSWGLLRPENNALRQQRDKLAEVLGNVEREHELLRRMKNCEILRGRGSFGIAVMSDTHAIEWQALDKELQQLIDARRAALSELTP